MENIQLPSNHKRSLSSSIFLVEKLVDEIETLLSTDKNLVNQTIKRDISEDKRSSVLKSIQEVKKEIKRLSERYDLKKQVVTESHFLDSRKTKVWEILHNSSASRMNGFGTFPEEYKESYDADIEYLLELVSRL